MEHLIQFLGRLHPLVVHLPIGILLIAIILYFVCRKPRFASWRIVLPGLWFAGAVTAVLACLAGFLLKISGGYEPEEVDAHQYSGLVLALVAIALFLAQGRLKSPRLHTAGVVVLAFLLLATGHYGGNLTHGDDYLTQPLYALAGKQPVTAGTIKNINEALVYRDLIEPVLQQKCLQCHRAGNQKGELRLDTTQFLFQQGEHGDFIVAGDASQSDLYRRLMLPAGHADRMPPKGKPQLTPAEVQLIYWWINEGQASMTKKVAELKKDPQTEIILAALSPGKDSDRIAGGSSGKPSEIPQKKVKKADPAVLRQLESLGVALTPLTADQVFLAANLVNAPHFSDKHMPLLLKLQDQLLWLDLSETAITDNALPLIARFKNLTRLRLDNTRVTDAGIVHLKALPGLRSLNLYGTKVSDKGLQALHACKNLEAVYLWQTQVTAPGVAALQDALGKQVEINFGNITDENAGKL